jgi:hypothetical protein
MRFYSLVSCFPSFDQGTCNDLFILIFFFCFGLALISCKLLVIQYQVVSNKYHTLHHVFITHNVAIRLEWQSFRAWYPHNIYSMYFQKNSSSAVYPIHKTE